MSPNKRGAARSVADVSAGVVLASVEIEVPPERVFRAISDPAEIVQWWGSAETYRVTRGEADVRVGGRWRNWGSGADGHAFSVGGQFLEVDPPRRLVLTWEYDWEPNAPATTIRYQLEPIPAGTRLTVRHEGFAGRVDACRSHGDGWERVLGWLTGHLLPAKPGPTPVPPVPVSVPGPPTNLKPYVLGMLLQGPRFHTQPPEEARALMQRHLAFIRTQIEAGRFVFASPLLDGGPVVGLVYVRAGTVEEALALMREDPGVREGRFVAEAHPSWAPDLDVVQVRY